MSSSSRTSMTYELVRISKDPGENYHCIDTNRNSHEFTKDQLNVDIKFIKQADDGYSVDLRPLVRLRFGHFDEKTFVWGGSDLSKIDESFFAKWGSESEAFDQGSKHLDKITRRIPDDDIEKWKKVVRIPHGKKGAFWTGARTRSQSRLISVERSLNPDSNLIAPRLCLSSKQALVQQTGKNCVANSV